VAVRDCQLRLPAIASASRNSIKIDRIKALAVQGETADRSRVTLLTGIIWSDRRDRVGSAPLDLAGRPIEGRRDDAEGVG
jgi:hypothetical protein